MTQKQNSATVDRGAKPVSPAKNSARKVSMTTQESIEKSILKYGAALDRLADR